MPLYGVHIVMPFTVYRMAGNNGVELYLAVGEMKFNLTNIILLYKKYRHLKLLKRALAC